MAREDQFKVTLSIDGTDFGVWDKMTGGEKDSDESKYKPGGMAPEVSLGGSSTVNNITLSRLYELPRDHPLLPTLFAKVGKGIAVISKQPLDIEGAVFGKPTVYNAVLKQVTPPDHDSMSSDAAMIELEFSPSGVIG